MEYVNNKELNNLFSSRSIYSTIELYQSMSKTLDELKKSDIKKRMQKVYENNASVFGMEYCCNRNRFIYRKKTMVGY